MKLTPTQENYLKAVLELGECKEAVRVTDVANHLKVTKAAVSKALQKLVLLGLASKETYGAVFLTEAGRRKALEIRERNRIIRGFLTGILGIDAKTACLDACLAEHTFSAETLRKIELLNNK